MKARLLGIDPGIYGAYAILDYDGGSPTIHHVEPLPISQTLQGKDQLDIHGFLEGLERYAPYSMCALEQVGVRSGEGPVGAFTFGRMCGRLEACLCSKHVPFCQPTPQSWKKVVFSGSGVPLKGDKDSQKAAAVSLVKSRYPNVSLRRTRLARTDDHNMAEAILLALYALHYLQLRTSNP